MIPQISDGALNKIAAASQQVPRTALLVLRELSVRNFGKPVISEDYVDELLTLMKVEPNNGLNYLQCKLLCFLLKQPEYTARVGIITGILGVDMKYFHTEIEPELVKKHFLDRSSAGGRKLQRNGVDFAVSLDATRYQA